MNTVLLHIHSFVAYLFLLSGLVSLFNAMSGYFQKQAYGNTKFSLAKATFIFSHIQLLLGLALWFTSDIFTQLKTNTAAVMADKSMRLLAVEHPTTNIIAIALLTIGYLKIKKTDDAHKKHLYNFVFYGIAIVLILSRIPFKQWVN